MRKRRRNGSTPQLVQQLQDAVFHREGAAWMRRNRSDIVSAVSRGLSSAGGSIRKPPPRGTAATGKAVTAHSMPYALVNVVAKEYAENWQPGGPPGERELMQGFLAAADSKSRTGNTKVLLTADALETLPRFLSDLQFDLDDKARGGARKRQRREQLKGGFGGASSRAKYVKARKALGGVLSKYPLTNPRSRRRGGRR